jgi:hypothetical protein
MDGTIDSVLDVDPAGLSHDERLDLLERIEHARSAIDAQAQLTLVALAREGDAEQRSKEWVREEVACVLSLAPVTAAARLHDAVDLVGRLPRTFDRLVDGSITFLHARSLLEAVRDLDDATVAKVEARVLPRAEGQAIGIFRQSVKRAVLALDPRTAQQKHGDALSQRRVGFRADDDGMACVWSYLRADAAMGLMNAVDAHARALPDDGRTADQKRADVFADLGSLALANASATSHGRRPAVQVTVALSTLLAMDEQPGELDGYGPIPAALARDIAHEPTGTWRRLLIDDAGRLIRCGRTTYKPPPALRNHVLAAHPNCTFPGCRRRSCLGEIDHIVAFHAGGATDAENLHPPCGRHHHVKHDAGWRVRKRTDGVTWISPTGRSYETPVHTHPVDSTARARPQPPDDDPPPF